MNSNNLVKEIFQTYSANTADNLTIVTNAANGVNIKAFFDFITLSGYNKEEAAGLFNVSLKTFMRYKKENKNLAPLYGEMVLKLIALYKLGLEIFGSVPSFNSWLKKENFGLGNLVPKNLMNISGGIDLIAEELENIKYGNLS
ncbi:MAG: DUF2384 domain-containing protein [Melioribacteraceae bacterium]|nr:DUF2384 domain-containing protein [Melioribacteraceae bacterium]